MGKKKKLLLCLAAALVILLAALALFRSSYQSVTIVSGKEHVVACPRYARPGREVTVATVVVDDAEIYVNGADGEYVRPGVYVFTMPDEDVQLNVTVISYLYGA